MCNVRQKHFSIVSRLNSTEYAELREKLHAPIRNSANVVIHQTISELFLETFRAQVDLNEPYTLPIGQVHYCSCPCADNSSCVTLCECQLKCPINVLSPYAGDRALYRLYAGSSKHQVGQTLPHRRCECVFVCVSACVCAFVCSFFSVFVLLSL